MTAFRTVLIDGFDIFYREAGFRDPPTILLLHGFPTSSHMFRNLMPALAYRFHLVAPDYPGFGNSSMPTVNEFDYTFDRLADIVENFTLCDRPQKIHPLRDGLWCARWLSNC